MKFSAMVQYPNRTQWTMTHVKRADGKGFTNYGLEAASWDDAIRALPALYRKGRKAHGEIADLLAGDSAPDFVLLSCEDPREHRTIKWSDVCAR